MKKIIFFASIVIMGISFTGMYILGVFQNDKNQTAEIEKKIEKDSVFIKDDLKDLPLLLFENTKSEKDYFVILFSGDGGWRGFIHQLAQTISDKGTSVVRVNVLYYLKHEKKPEQIAKDIHRIINNFLIHGIKKMSSLVVILSAVKLFLFFTIKWTPVIRIRWKNYF
jgi:type IV secretory pathway VirJ component